LALRLVSSKWPKKPIGARGELAMAKHDLSAPTVATYSTPYGMIAIGGEADDYHRTGNHGANSAHQAVGYFHEFGGDDTYRWGQLARAGQNNYHGGTSLSYFLDSGGSRDEFPGYTKDGFDHRAP
jgi:hypothetical protein